MYVTANKVKAESERELDGVEQNQKCEELESERPAEHHQHLASRVNRKDSDSKVTVQWTR